MILLIFLFVINTFKTFKTFKTDILYLYIPRSLIPFRHNIDVFIPENVIALYLFVNSTVAFPGGIIGSSVAVISYCCPVKVSPSVYKFI